MPRLAFKSLQTASFSFSSYTVVAQQSVNLSLLLQGAKLSYATVKQNSINLISIVERNMQVVQVFVFVLLVLLVQVFGKDVKDMMRKSIVFDKNTPDVFYCPIHKPTGFDKLIVK